MDAKQQLLDGLFFQNEDRLATIEEASKWATDQLKRSISKSNISYLVQYGQVRTLQKGGVTLIDLDDLQDYYHDRYNGRESHWKEKLGDDLNWALSFEHLREVDTTKHVHRLHPYKGKFIPQLVQYFLDDHTDSFKLETYFKPGDIVLDPFAGSGTTLVQAGEMGIHSIGIDISRFNCMMINVKLGRYELITLCKEIGRVNSALANFCADSNIIEFESELTEKLLEFNRLHFPSRTHKRGVQNREIDDDGFGVEKEKEFLKIHESIKERYRIEIEHPSPQSFLDKWYCINSRKEIEFTYNIIQSIDDENIRRVLLLILSRTIRSCRATTHFDLATLKEPKFSPYYCWKHKKICKPIFSIKSWFNRYSKDTISRLQEFNNLRSSSHFAVLAGDARTVDVFSETARQNSEFSKILEKKKIRGIFTSPPYVGQIDYHEQHAYAYDLFDIERNDSSEIGPMFKGQGIAARKAYVDGIACVLKNCRKYLAKDAHIFVVANDKHNLYPEIAKFSNLEIVNSFKRPVLNRTERDKAPYSEIIFHMKIGD